MTVLHFLPNEGLVNVGDDTTAGDSGANQAVQLLVPSDGQLQMARRDPLHFQILTGVAGQFQHFSCQILHDGGGVDGGGWADAPVRGGTVLQVAVNSADRELKACTCRTWHRLGLDFACVFSRFASRHLRTSFVCFRGLLAVSTRQACLWESRLLAQLRLGLCSTVKVQPVTVYILLFLFQVVYLQRL